MTQAKTNFVNTSGWTAEEIEQLEAMVKADGIDRSKFIRGLVRKEHQTRTRTTRPQRSAVRNARTAVAA